MSEIIAFPLPSGPNFTIPDVGDTNWGQNVTNFLVAIPAGVMPTSGTFTLTGDVSFGASFGLISKYFTSLTANAAHSGLLRQAKTDVIAWRNNVNNADLLLGINGSDQLTYNGTVIGPSVTPVTSITGTAHQIIVSSPTGNITLSTPQNIDTDSTPTFASETLSAITNQLVLGTTNTTTLSATAPSASRVYTLPDVGNSANITLDKGPFTITGNWEFNPPTGNGITISGAPTLSDAAPYSVELVNDGSTTNASMKISTYGDPGVIFAQNVIHYYRARGSVASPAATQSGDFLADTGYRGYASGAYTNSQASDRVEATETWTSTNLGCKFHWETTQTGTNARIPILDLTGAGLVLLGSSTIAMGGNKITGLASGTASTDAATFGQIFTGFQAPVQQTSTSATSTTGITYVATNTSAAIAPTSSAHRIKITVSGTCTVIDNTVDMFVTIQRGATNLAGANGFQIYNSGTGTSISAPCSITFIDSPATTSSTTYAVYIKGDNNGKAVTWGSSSTTTVITLEEIV